MLLKSRESQKSLDFKQFIWQVPMLALIGWSLSGNEKDTQPHDLVTLRTKNNKDNLPLVLGDLELPSQMHRSLLDMCLNLTYLRHRTVLGRPPHTLQ